MNQLETFICLLLLILISCKTKKNVNPTSSMDDECMTIVVDAKQFEECQGKLNYTIDSAYVEQENLFVKVSYSGGCKEHVFDFTWNRIMMKSYPPQFQLCLAHEAKGDNCEALLTKTLCVKLDGLDNPIGVVRLNGWKGRLQFGEKK